MNSNGNGRRRRARETPFVITLADMGAEDAALHPGWTRATAILLRGLERLENREAGRE